MGVVRRGLIGTIVAIFGVVAALGVGYSAVAKPGNRHHAQKLAKALKKCRKDKPRSKRRTCEKTAKAKHESKTETGGYKRTGPGTGTGTPTRTGTTTGPGTATGTGAGTGTATGTGTAGTTTGTIGNGTNSGVLHIAWDAGEEGIGLSYSLSCNPTSGTFADPVAVCADIAQDPNMVFERPAAGHSCPAGLDFVEVSGEYDGLAVKLTESPCGADGALGVWASFLPSVLQEDAVSVDHGIGPFTLGEEESSAATLLGHPSGAAGGLNVYYRESVGSTNCDGKKIGLETVMAIRYDSAGHALTIIANRSELRVGERYTPFIGQLVTKCEGDEPRAEGPFAGWLPLTCGGREAFADRPLSEDSPEGTTIVVPADQFPFVIVTSTPTSACEDVARLHAEWTLQ